MMAEKVSAVECGSYETEEVYSAVREALDRIGFTVPENRTVLIKPNIMSQNTPEQNTITHYTVVDALCRIFSEKGNRLLIGESISFYMKGLTEEAFRTSRIDVVAAKYGARLVPFEKEPLVEVNGLYIPKVLLEADVVVNACKLKTHLVMRMSGAIKNMFGCLPGGYKQKIHMRSGSRLELAEVFVSVNETIKPALNVMDAVVSLDGGPAANGKPVKTGRILASANPAALDAAACRMMGYSPEEIPALVCARNKGMLKDFSGIEVLGSIERKQFKKIKRGPINEGYKSNGFFSRNGFAVLSVDSSKCTGCGKCIRECPADAMRLEQDKAAIDKARCVNCYHCIYACPENVVSADQALVIRFIWKLAKILKLA
jgi:uncharacterized protein (DUF362 family)/NAD-dependent dihydropyrimidine dehydrogenase PreA subunit